jgi:hypothetical protein
MPECDLKTPSATTALQPLRRGAALLNCDIRMRKVGVTLAILPSDFALPYSLQKYATFLMAILCL